MLDGPIILPFELLEQAGLGLVLIETVLLLVLISAKRAENLCALLVHRVYGYSETPT